MFWKPKNKEANRYYLLPSMGRCNRRHRKQVFYVAVGVGILSSIVVGVVLYLVQAR